jgi:hypothetical protein
MPMFSPDGTQLVFNDYAIDKGHGLAIMRYDTADDSASNYRQLTTETAPLRPGWPFFLPDGKAVVYVRTASSDFSGNGAGLGGSANGPVSDLQLVDIASGQSILLAKAVGYASQVDVDRGRPYLPFGDEDLHHSYFPTVSPVAAGGYFWLFFDAVRHYGNQGVQRQLWGAAIDIHADGKYVVDPSHPAFYLPGQEFGTGNHRAFAALDACKKDGDKCTSGIDCCGGSCTFPDSAAELVEPVGTCGVPPAHTCAKHDERCTTSADCCPPLPGEQPDSCIAGFCAQISLN